MASFAQGFPQAPFVDPQTGDINSVWRFFLLSLFNRTGGGVGTSTADLSTAIATEKTDRATADTAIVASVTAEVSARSAAVTAETDARLAAEAVLAADIATLAGGGTSQALVRWWIGAGT